MEGIKWGLSVWGWDHGFSFLSHDVFGVILSTKPGSPRLPNTRSQFVFSGNANHRLTCCASDGWATAKHPAYRSYPTADLYVN